MKSRTRLIIASLFYDVYVSSRPNRWPIPNLYALRLSAAIRSISFAREVTTRADPSPNLDFRSNKRNFRVVYVLPLIVIYYFVVFVVKHPFLYGATSTQRPVGLT